MKYTVVLSEGFKTVVEGGSTRDAAQQALTLWKLKNDKSKLSKIVVVVKPDNTEVYLPTKDLMEVLT